MNVTDVHPELLMYTPDVQKFIIKRYGSVLMVCTREQAEILMQYAVDSYLPASYFEPELRKLCLMLDKLCLARRQFPCKARRDGECVRAHVRNRMKDIYDRRVAEIDALLDKAQHIHGYELFNTLIEIKSEMLTAINNQAENKWNAVRYDMMPPHILEELIDNAHNNALRMNEEFDRNVAIDNAMAKLSPEERELFKGVK